MADQSWREQPKVISPEVIEATCHNIAEHVDEHAIPQVDVVLHGGEPLLAGHRDESTMRETDINAPPRWARPTRCMPQSD